MSVKGLVARASLAGAADEWRARGQRIVFTNGCFDLLHPGHVALLADAAALGDVLLVAINDDESVRRLKGAGRPIYSHDDRSEILLALRWVDAVTIFPEDTPQETIEIVVPDVLVKGSEYEEADIVGAREVRSWGGDVVRVPMRAGWSTSAIIAAIRDQRD